MLEKEGIAKLLKEASSFRYLHFEIEIITHWGLIKHLWHTLEKINRVCIIQFQSYNAMLMIS